MSISTGNIAPAAHATIAPSYEERLQSDLEWALNESGRHFEQNSLVFETMRRIAARLNELNIPYAVVGGMGLFRLGYRRYTEDVDILVRKKDVRLIHKKLEGLGYRRLHAKSRHLRDTQSGVKIEFLTSGDYPGDGKKKPIAFPDPASVSDQVGQIGYINLEHMIELKLASGMTGADRRRDLSDVLELIKALKLPADFSEKLDPYVRPTYQQLWEESRGRFGTLWRNKWLTSNAKTIEDMIASLRAAAAELEEMRRDGVTLDPDGVADDYAYLVTSDPEVAKKYDMIDKFDLLEDDEEDDDSSDEDT
jgi:hypothetical protein